MDITIPLFALRRGQTSGLESAIFNLMRGLVATGSNLRVAIAGTEDLPETVVRWINEKGIPVERYPRLGQSMSSRFVEESLFGMLARAPRVLSPNYFLPPGGPRLGQRAVVIHDLQHKVFPENFGSRKVRWLDWQFRRTLRHADKVIFISNFELQQARHYYGDLAGERAIVVHNAIDWCRFDEGTASDTVHKVARRPFILSVAQDYPHKRLPLLIRAFGKLAGDDDEIQLLLVGRATDKLRKLALEELGAPLIDRVGFLGFVSDADLAHLYKHAALFALPSAYEGFGMPAVEALGLGCPALVTDSTALPEVTLGGADYVSPDAGAGEWAERISMMLRSRRRAGASLQEEIRSRFNPLTAARQVELAFGA